MNYSQALAEVEDSEINIRVGESFGWNAYFIHREGSVTFRDDKGRLKGKKNYCHNPSDSWPIIQLNRICITHHSKDWEWHCYAHGLNQSIINKNPLRAAMIVFLLMQDAKNA